MGLLLLLAIGAVVISQSGTASTRQPGGYTNDPVYQDWHPGSSGGGNLSGPAPPNPFNDPDKRNRDDIALGRMLGPDRWERASPAPAGSNGSGRPVPPVIDPVMGPRIQPPEATVPGGERLGPEVGVSAFLLSQQAAQQASTVQPTGKVRYNGAKLTQAFNFTNPTSLNADGYEVFVSAGTPDSVPASCIVPVIAAQTMDAGYGIAITAGPEYHKIALEKLNGHAVARGDLGRIA